MTTYAGIRGEPRAASDIESGQSGDANECVGGILVQASHEGVNYEVRRRIIPGRVDDKIGSWLPRPGHAEASTPTRAAKSKRASWRRPDLIRGSDVRKVRVRGSTRYTADIPVTRLNGKLVSAENLLQADFVLVTDAQDADVVGMRSQPLTIEITVDGRKRKWIPDYLIERSTGPRELVDVEFLSRLRPSDLTERDRMRRRLAARDAAACEAGYRHRVVTEQEIRIEPMLYNAKLIHRHHGPFFDQALLLKGIMAVARLNCGSSIADLGDALGKPQFALALCIRLDRLGHIRLDRSAKFSRNTRFSLVEAPCSGAHLR